MVDAKNTDSKDMQGYLGGCVCAVHATREHLGTIPPDTELYYTPGHWTVSDTDISYPTPSQSSRASKQNCPREITRVSVIKKVVRVHSH
jgi:hypothetical protein